MGLFWKSKREKAIEDLKTQFGIDLYESGNYRCDKWQEYLVSILEGYDFIAVINQKENGVLVAKEWYKYKKSKGWVQLASMNCDESFHLYLDTKPYAYQGAKWTKKDIESAASMICGEYISTFMTEYYFNKSIRPFDDVSWGKGKSHTEAIYMPYRDPPPAEETDEEREARIDRIVDEMEDLINEVKRGK